MAFYWRPGSDNTVVVRQFLGKWSGKYLNFVIYFTAYGAERFFSLVFFKNSKIVHFTKKLLLYRKLFTNLFGQVPHNFSFNTNIEVAIVFKFNPWLQNSTCRSNQNWRISEAGVPKCQLIPKCPFFEFNWPLVLWRFHSDICCLPKLILFLLFINIIIDHNWS